MLFGSDEFGQEFFPLNDTMFAVTGSKHVTCSIWDDKRQYTGNIIHNAAGIYSMSDNSILDDILL